MKLWLLLFAFGAFAFGQTRVATIQWNHVADPPAVSFNVYRATGACSGTSLTWAKVNTSPILAKTFTDSPVPYGVYCYRITALAGTLESAPSNLAEGQAVPQAPTGATVTIATAEITVTKEGQLAARLEVKTAPAQ